MIEETASKNLARTLLTPPGSDAEHESPDRLNKSQKVSGAPNDCFL